MQRFVLDCSLCVSWLFPDENDAYAESILTSIRQCEAFVPQLWHLEIANTLLNGERDDRLSVAELQEGLSFLRSLFITTDSRTNEAAWDDTLSLARKHDLTVYDASYLELALRHNLPIATLDKPLAKAAKKCGVEIFKP